MIIGLFWPGITWPIIHRFILTQIGDLHIYLGSFSRVCSAFTLFSVQLWKQHLMSPVITKIRMLILDQHCRITHLAVSDLWCCIFLQSLWSFLSTLFCCFCVVSTGRTCTYYFIYGISCVCHLLVQLQRMWCSIYTCTKTVKAFFLFVLIFWSILDLKRCSPEVLGALKWLYKQRQS